MARCVALMEIVMTDEEALEAQWVEEVAQLVAVDEARWSSRKVLLSWDALRLQLGTGKLQRELASLFKVDRSTISNWQSQKNPLRVQPEHAPLFARMVRRALTIRRRMLGLAPDDAWDDAMCAVAAPSPPMLLLPGDGGAGVRALDAPVGASGVSSRWEDMAHAAQLPPEGAWRTWMLMGGRGAGKTRAGAEWVRGLVERGAAKRVALVGPTLHDVREVMIGGPSGLCAIGDPAMRPRYEVTRRRLVWPNVGPCAGAVALAFSAEDPDSLRGPQFDAAWCDEIGAWARDEATWETLAFGMRLGDAPRIVATTTPRPRALVKRLVDRAEKGRGGVVMTQAGTRANAANLAPDFVAALEEDYAGTALGRQELDGDLIEDVAGALWSRAVIEDNRAHPDEAGGLERVVVAVDPPAGATGKSDACGIVVAGVKDGVVYVLADASVRGLRPSEWAGRVMAAARGWGAGLVVAEANQGGEMVRDVLERAGEAGDSSVRVKLLHATTGKQARAEPVSMLYDKARVRHVRVLKELEDEMCSFGASDMPGRGRRSPDRVDALVWAVSELTGKGQGRPGISAL